MRGIWLRATTAALVCILFTACDGQEAGEKEGGVAEPQPKRRQAGQSPAGQRVERARSEPGPLVAPSQEGERPGMVRVVAGEFLMGSAADDRMVYPWEKPREQPQHPVYLDEFYIDRYEVTNRQYERFDPGHQRHKASPCDDCPVVRVSWFQAKKYCEAEKPPKRLPTEAEWEKAAKGGGRPLTAPFRDSVWYDGNSIERAQPVGRKRPNGYGLYDMLGNVREWTADWYDPGYYAERVRDNPKGPATGVRRVERGGAFFLPRRGVTTTIRYNHPPKTRLYFLGFRCARDP